MLLGETDALGIRLGEKGQDGRGEEYKEPIPLEYNRMRGKGLGGRG